MNIKYQGQKNDVSEESLRAMFKDDKTGSFSRTLRLV